MICIAVICGCLSAGLLSLCVFAILSDQKKLQSRVDALEANETKRKRAERLQKIRDRRKR